MKKLYPIFLVGLISSMAFAGEAKTKQQATDETLAHVYGSSLYHMKSNRNECQKRYGSDQALLDSCLNGYDVAQENMSQVSH